MSEPSHRAIVVTGAAGFIGGRVAQRLCQTGHRVVAVDLPGRSYSHLPHLGNEVRETDLTDAQLLPRSLERVDARAVVHCAALMGGWRPASEYRRVNVEGTRNIAAWAAATGVSRFFYLSSVTVYGMPPVEGIDEQTPFRHMGLPYADSKIEAEAMLAAFRASGLRTTILRPGDVYGPRASEWVIKLVDSMRAGKMILISGGRGLVNVTHVDNLVDAIEAAMQIEAAAGRDYIITDGAPVTWKKYLEALAQAAGCPPPKLSLPASLAWPAVVALETAGRITKRKPPLSRLGLRLLTARSTYSIARATAELGWRPRVAFQEGMDGVGRWLEQESGLS